MSDVCSKIYTLYDTYLETLREYVYREEGTDIETGMPNVLMNLDANLITKILGKKSRLKDNVINFMKTILRKQYIAFNYIIKHLGFAMIRYQRLRQLEEQLQKAYKFYEVHRTFHIVRFMELMRVLTTKRSELVDVCNMFADTTSKESFVKAIMMEINKALFADPCFNIKEGCIDLSRVVNSLFSDAPNGVKILLSSKWYNWKIVLVSVRNLFKLIMPSPDTTYEIFVYEMYKDPVNNIHPKENYIIIDAGAFWGDTIAWASLYATGTAYAIEYDKNAISIMRKNLFDDELARKHIEPRLKVKIVQTKIDGTKPLEAYLEDPMLKTMNGMYIKSDIEGYERVLIESAKNVLFEYKPELAISAYHRGDDLLVLPSLIVKYNDSYKLYMRKDLLGESFSIYAK